MTQQQMNNKPTYQQPFCSSCAVSNESNTTTTRQRHDNDTTTTANVAERCVPQLRFPEFLDAGEWKPTTLGNVAKVKSGYAFKSSDYIKNGRYKIIAIRNVQNGYLDLSECSSIEVLPKDIQSYQILKEGDILISMTGNVGRVCKVSENNCLLNQRVGVISIFNDDVDKDFIYSLLIDRRFQKFMIESGQGAAQANISNKDIENYTFTYPESKVEQKKIATCLLKIDDEIVTTTQKLEQLKTHKKALLQKLFPQRGKTVPELRFPEFQNAGEWVEKAFGDCLDYEQPQNYIVSSENYKRSGVPVLTAGKTFVLGYTDENYGVYTDLPVIIFDDFTTACQYVDFAFKVKSSAIKMLQTKKGYDLKFMYETIQRYTYEPREHQRHWISIYSKFRILVPSSINEQQKIANILQSIDYEIYVITYKLALLRFQKDALLQQLFPHL